MEEDMLKREAEGKEGEVYLLLPQRDLLQMKTSGPGDQGPKGSPPESQDTLEKISRHSGHPALEGLLLEFKDVFPEDLPAETPPEREIFCTASASQPQLLPTCAVASLQLEWDVGVGFVCSSATWVGREGDHVFVFMLL